MVKFTLGTTEDIMIPVTQSIRILSVSYTHLFPDEVADVLRAYLPYRRNLQAMPGHENALFLSLQKKRISVDAIENMVKKYARIAAPLKRKISPHKLRTTFGTNLYHETGDIYLVADVLGHADVNTTRRHYADCLLYTSRCV